MAADKDGGCFLKCSRYTFSKPLWILVYMKTS